MPSPLPYSPNSPAITTTYAPTSPPSPSSSPEVIGEFTLDALSLDATPRPSPNRPNLSAPPPTPATPHIVATTPRPIPALPNFTDGGPSLGFACLNLGPSPAETCKIIVDRSTGGGVCPPGGPRARRA
ncbi:hypothetical protein CcaverHIS631_0306680 [Cutaneotrichosporon cavernicola]|nr:hypothetical protein CcaverHIS631_0306680 [Cutaneotrichosporon cavernicola]